MTSRDRGAMSLSLAMIFPAVSLLIWLTIQGTFWWYDRQVALGAARQGSEVAAAASPSGTAADGTAEARQWMYAAIGTGADKGVRSWQRVSGNVVTVYAQLRAQPVLPGFFPMTITVHVSAPIERFAPVGS